MRRWRGRWTGMGWPSGQGTEGPWRFLPTRWDQCALLVVALVGLVLLAISSGGEDPDRFVLFYLPVLVILGLSQRRTLLLAIVPVAIATFVVGFGAAGALQATTVAQFALVLLIAVALSVARPVAIGLSVGSVGLRTPSVQLGLAHLVDGTRALDQATQFDEAVALFEQAVADLVGADGVATFVRAPAPDDRLLRVDPFHPDLVVAPADLVALVDSRRRQFVPSLADWSATGAADLVPGASPPIARSALFIPLIGQDGPLGFALLGWPRLVAPLSDVADEAVELLVVDAVEAIDRCRHRQTLAEAPLTDPLTGLLSRRVVDTRLDELESGDVVMVIDLDDFRGYNARRGASAGDRTVRSLAACLVDSCRRADWCGRLSHEEFIVVFRGAGDSATVAVSRLRDRWSQLESEAKFSAGVAIHEHGARPVDTLAHAEGALDLAKDRGRDRVEFFPGDAQFGNR